MKTISKIAAIALVAFAVVGVNTASAATAAELQAMIASLTAQIAALSGTPSATTPAAVTFSTNLTVGSKGADVTALQNFLIGKGYNTLATGYFGPMTKAALAAYQTAKGITPAVGYFGPLTRAAVNGEAAVVVPPTPGTTTPGTLQGGDGDFSKFSVLGTPSSEDINEGQTAKVLGVEFTAKDSDLKLERAKILFSETASMTDKPWKVLEKVAIYNGSTKIGDIDASDEDNWDETANGSNDYEITLNNLNSIVKEDAKAKLYVEVTAQDNLDATDLGNWNISFSNDGIRALNADGINVYEGSAADTKDFTLDTAEAGDVSITVDSAENEDQAVTVDDDTDTNGVVGYTAEVKSKTGDNKIETVTVTLATTTTEVLSDMIGTVRLFIGNTEVGSESAASTVVFDDISKDMNEGDKVDFVVKFDLNDTNDGARYQNDDAFKVTGMTVDYVDSNDDDKTVTNATDGGVLTVSTTTIKVSKVSTSASQIGADETKGKFSVTFNVTAPADEDIYINKAGATAFTKTIINSSTGATTTATTSSVTLAKDSGGSTSGNYYVVSSGSTVKFTANVNIDNTGGGSRSLRVGLASIVYGVGSGADDKSYTSGLDENFETPDLQLFTADAQ